MRIRPLVLLSCLAALALPGCLAVAAGAAAGYGAVQYANNEARRDYAAALGATWDATLSALAEVGAPVPQPPALGPTEGEVEAGDFHVRLEAISASATRVRVHVGTFTTEDHRRRAGLLLDAIARRVGPA